jgi:hypothetical protein
MTKSQAAGLSNYANTVDELYTKGEVEALNLVLVEHGISSERILAILPVPAQLMSIPQRPPQFRVLYRTN